MEKRDTKQAVLLVHGMGEQMPMETLRGFVETMWVSDPGIVQLTQPPPGGNEVWFKPDVRNDTAELWRIATRRSKPNGQRVDFYEFYWADLTAGSTIDHLKDFYAFMLLRRPGQAPRRVRPIWLLLWAITLFFGVLSAWKALETAKLLDCLPYWLGPLRDWLVCVPDWVAPVLKIGGLAYAGIIGVIVAYLGDVARYCRAKPPNIAARRDIRERGLQRLKAIAGSGEYDRIVLVGHSLGAIIAYDVLKLYWAEWAAANPVAFSPLFSALVACKAAGDPLRRPPEGADPADNAAFRKAQYAVFSAASRDNRPEALRTTDYAPWLISDFVSVGAALSHAQFLLARDQNEFEKGRSERRFPASPPLTDGRFGYVYEGANGLRRIDHAACFSAVRWTNLHDVSGDLGGDLVSGPVAPLFGRGVSDRRVRIKRKSGLFGLFRRFFTHTLYWTDTRGTKDRKASVQLKELRLALDLVRARSPFPETPAP